MANPNKKHEKNIPGKWYCTHPDDDGGEGCTGCGICISGAPDNFDGDDEGMAFVKKRPENEDEVALCEEQLESCPVQAIGNDG